ncbi:MAG: hypothetical protein AAF799_45130 [Myxococcota bacterium]
MTRTSRALLLPLLAFGLSHAACVLRVELAAEDDAADGGTWDPGGGLESGPPPADESTGVEGECNNGQLEPGEDCDDGNPVDADGCNTDCRISGSIAWSVEFGSDDDSTEAFAVAVDSLDFIAVTGSQFFPQSESFDYWVRRIDPDGVEQWVDTVPDDVWVRDLDTGPDDHIIIAGGRAQPDDDPSLMWAQRYATDGAIAQTLEQPLGALGGGASAVAFTPSGTILGGGYESLFAIDTAPLWLAGVEYGVEDIVVSSAGGFAIAGFASGDEELGYVSWYADPNRGVDPSWTETDPTAVVTGVALDGAGNVVVAGRGSSTTPGFTAWLQKFAPDGTEQWQVNPMSEFDAEEAVAVAVDGHDRIVVVGHVYDGFNNHPWIQKLDTHGMMRWDLVIEDEDMDGSAEGVAIDSQDEILVAMRVGPRGRLVKLRQ